MNPAKTFIVACLAIFVLLLLPGAAHAWTEVPAQAVPQQTPTPFDMPTANSAANLRAGPGTEYAKMGTVEAGQPIWIISQNSKGDWLQLRTGVWIAASLVNNAPAALPVVSNTYANASPEEAQYLIDMTRLYNALAATFFRYLQNPGDTGNDEVMAAINNLEEWRASASVPSSLIDQAARLEVQTDICYPVLNGPFTYDAVGMCILLFMLPDAIPNKFRDSSQVGGAPLLQEPAAPPAPTPTPTAQPKPAKAATPTPTPALAPNTYTVNQHFTVGNFQYQVRQAIDRGQFLKSNNMFEDDRSTTGKFIEVIFDAKNVGADSNAFRRTGGLIDGQGRKFDQISMSDMFVDDKYSCSILDPIQPSFTKVCSVIFEVAADSADFTILFVDQEMFGGDEDAKVYLGG